jgi:Zn-dependent protease with chaperone function
MFNFTQIATSIIFTGGIFDIEKLVFLLLALLSGYSALKHLFHDPEKAIRTDINVKTLDPEEYGFVYEMVNDLCNKIETPAPVLLFHPHPTANMAACRTSCIILYAGIFKYLNKEELRAMLAHELVHIKEQHIKKRLQFQVASVIITYMLQFFRIVFLRGISGTTQGMIIYAVVAVLMSVISSFGLTFLLQRMCRAQELEADSFSVLANKDVDSAVSGIKKLNGNMEFTPSQERWRPHPSTSKRVAKIEEIAKTFAPS